MQTLIALTLNVCFLSSIDAFIMSNLSPRWAVNTAAVSQWKDGYQSRSFGWRPVVYGATSPRNSRPSVMSVVNPLAYTCTVATSCVLLRVMWLCPVVLFSTKHLKQVIKQNVGLKKTIWWHIQEKRRGPTVAYRQLGVYLHVNFFLFISFLAACTYSALEALRDALYKSTTTTTTTTTIDS